MTLSDKIFIFNNLCSFGSYENIGSALKHSDHRSRHSASVRNRFVDISAIACNKILALNAIQIKTLSDLRYNCLVSVFCPKG